MKARLGAALACALLLTAGCSSGDDDTAPGTTRATTTAPAPCPSAVGHDPEPTPQTFEIDGLERKYLLAVPEGYDGATPAPVVVDLHGFTSTAEAQDGASRLSEKGTKRGYVVVTPQALDADVGGGPQPLWNVFGAEDTSTTLPTSTTEPVEEPVGNDLTFLNGLLDHLEDELCLDESREYVTGMSNGAGMSTWLVCQPSNRFAAAAYVSGINQVKACPASTVPPFIAFHGDADVPDPYTGGDLAGFPLGIPAVEDRVEEFGSKQGCSGERTEREVADDVVLISWSCPAGKAAELYKILGGSHSWPGSESTDPGTTQSIDASDLMLDFFDEHHR